VEKDMSVHKLVRLGRVCLLASGFLAFAAIGASHAAEIGISWPGKSASILIWEKAFKDRLAVIAPDIKVESIKEVPTTEEFGVILKRFDAEKDAIVLFRSNSAEYVKSNPTTKPPFSDRSTMWLNWTSSKIPRSRKPTTQPRRTSWRLKCNCRASSP